jgi:hypothetical protein
MIINFEINLFRLKMYFIKLKNPDMEITNPQQLVYR